MEMLYYHDLDSYNLTTNCFHIPTREILERGFNTGYGTIKPPKKNRNSSRTIMYIIAINSK